jgi:hypothetical protein
MDDDRIILTASISQYGDATDVHRSYPGEIEWTKLMKDFVALLNHHGYQINSKVIEIDHTGDIVSTKHRGRD